MDNYKTFYKDLLGFYPYDYQIKVAQYLLEGKNVILSIPTGAGKTLASVMPFLYAIQNGINAFPQKMIYSLPLRTLANSIYSDLRGIFNQDKVKSKYPLLHDLISLQTGEYSEDPLFEKRMVFSTIDQTLSNFLCFPLPLSKRQANINAGSLIGSYLIFDEFHLLDPKLSMATTLGMLRILKNMCRVCIMTATLTDDYIKFLQDEFGFVKVSLDDFPEDVIKIKSLLPAKDKSIKKSVSIADKTINADDILDKHKNKTIVICNRVETAQKIYFELKSKKENSTTLYSTTLLCIHSRFFDSDRKNKELLIKKYFGKDSSQKNVILVSTQVIEAGMDISCDVMHTEISPINSFLQRAGRCARFASEYGDVYVYDVLNLDEKNLINEDGQNDLDKNEIRKLNNKYLPYSKYLCLCTINELKEVHSLNEVVATELVNKVLKEDEQQKVGNITEKQFNLEIIRKSWNDCEKKHYRETIRDIQSIDIVLFNIEENEDKKLTPWLYETISVYKWSFIGWANKMVENKIDDDDWIFAKAEQANDSQYDSDWQDKESYFLRRLQINEIKEDKYNDAIFVDNRYFDYNEAGFIVARNENGYTSPMKEKKDDIEESFIYKKDTFYQHNKALLNCFETEFKPYLNFTFSELNKYWGENVDWEKIIKLTICLHDYGKLNVTWQKSMLKFERNKLKNPKYFEVLAHTDYVENVDKELAKECGVKNKPAHAGIGAMQAYDIIYDEYSENEQLARTVSNAILKHHSVESKTFCDFKITDVCIKEMNKLLVEQGLNYSLFTQERGAILDMPNTDKEWILYLFLVRILRMCDQKATESIEKYYKDEQI
jgi:CRISPR-associated endonuclease/helicase Cas3